MLQRFRIVREVKTLIAKLGHDQLDHERFEPEAIAFLFLAAGPKFYEPHDLGKMLLLRLLSFAGKFKVKWDTRLQE